MIDSALEEHIARNIGRLFVDGGRHSAVVTYRDSDERRLISIHTTGLTTHDDDNAGTVIVTLHRMQSWASYAVTRNEHGLPWLLARTTSAPTGIATCDRIVRWMLNGALAAIFEDTKRVSAGDAAMRILGSRWGQMGLWRLRAVCRDWRRQIDVALEIHVRSEAHIRGRLRAPSVYRDACLLAAVNDRYGRALIRVLRDLQYSLKLRVVIHRAEVEAVYTAAHAEPFTLRRGLISHKGRLGRATRARWGAFCDTILRWAIGSDIHIVVQ